jgi:hypothetical protein
MPNIMRDLGNADGCGHELQVMFEDKEFGIIVSHDPDTDQSQRIVFLETQWRALHRLLNEIYGQKQSP